MEYAGLSEWFKEAVLKTVGREVGPGVRIPDPALVKSFDKSSVRHLGDTE